MSDEQVNSPHPDYTEALPRWQRCRDCHEGTDAVKGRAEAYLPRLASHKRPFALRERDDAYAAYLARAEFYNATARTIQGISGSMFQVSPTVEVPEGMTTLMQDVTGDGASVEGLASGLSREVLITGRAGLLVDVEREASPDNMPFVTMYRAEDVISWATERRNGVEVPTMVVLREYARIPGNPFRFDFEEQYRVLKVDASGFYCVEWWREVKKNEWAIFDTVKPVRRGTPLTFIPFVFVGPSSLSPDVQKPPLLDLVDLNLSHFRTMADLEHGRHLTSLPTIWLSGSHQGEEDVMIGSETVLLLGPDGKAGMLEFTGQGLGALERADADKRAKMAALGARLLEDPMQGETATAVTVRRSGESGFIKEFAQTIDEAMTTALKFAAYWICAGGADLTAKNPDKVKGVRFETDKSPFRLRANSTDVKNLLLALQAGTISYPTFYDALQGAGLARDGVTAEEERKAIAQDGEQFA